MRPDTGLSVKQWEESVWIKPDALEPFSFHKTNGTVNGFNKLFRYESVLFTGVFQDGRR